MMETPLVVQLLPLVGALALLGGLIFWGLKRSREEAKLGTGITPGFKGWLLVLAIVITLTPLRLLSDLIKYYSTPGMMRVFQEFPLAAYVEAAQNIILIVSALVTILYMVRKRKGFRIAFYIQYLIGTATIPLNLLLTYMVLSRSGIQVQLLDEAGMAEIIRWIAVVVIGGLWVAYVAKSRRVAMTFVN